MGAERAREYVISCSKSSYNPEDLNRLIIAVKLLGLHDCEAYMQHKKRMFKYASGEIPLPEGMPEADKGRVLGTYGRYACN